jgi:hypothetical protein
MTLETWSIILVAAAFLLLGIAISPLAWVALVHRRSRFEQQAERQWQAITERVGALEGRLEQFDRATNDQPSTAKHGEESGIPQGPHWLGAGHAKSKRLGADRAAAASAPTLIAVPSLAGPPSEREASINGLSHRYAAIWSLANSGASADVIARATGQPVGQIELILGLRRQIDTSRSKLTDGPEA